MPADVHATSTLNIGILLHTRLNFRAKVLKTKHAWSKDTISMTASRPVGWSLQLAQDSKQKVTHKDRLSSNWNRISDHVQPVYLMGKIQQVLLLTSTWIWYLNHDDNREKYKSGKLCHRPNRHDLSNDRCWPCVYIIWLLELCMNMTDYFSNIKL